MLRIINENETKRRVGKLRNEQWIVLEGYPELLPSFITLEELAAEEQLMTHEELQAKEIRVEEVADEIIKVCMRDIWKLNCLTLRGRAHYACEALAHGCSCKRTGDGDVVQGFAYGGGGA